MPAATTPADTTGNLTKSPTSTLPTFTMVKYAVMLNRLVYATKSAGRQLFIPQLNKQISRDTLNTMFGGKKTSFQIINPDTKVPLLKVFWVPSTQILLIDFTDPAREFEAHNLAGIH
jgi:hypothetical protein